MGIAEDVRSVSQDLIAPELREIRGQITPLNRRMDAAEEIHRIRYENLVRRLELIQQSFAFDRRISDLEAEKRRSA